jgi:hypothetical protein
MADSKETDDAICQVSGLLYSAVRVLEQVGGTPADEMGLGTNKRAIDPLSEQGPSFGAALFVVLCRLSLP